MPIFDLPHLSQAIQLALAPVFLLTGLAGFLNVMAGRLGRIIDRGRALEESESLRRLYTPTRLSEEIQSLEQRRRITGLAITAGTLSALLVCVVVAGVFMVALFGWQLMPLIGLLFIAALLALVAGLGFFLHEVQLSFRTVRLGQREGDVPGSQGPKA